MLHARALLNPIDVVTVQILWFFFLHFLCVAASPTQNNLTRVVHFFLIWNWRCLANGRGETLYVANGKSGSLHVASIASTTGDTLQPVSHVSTVSLLVMAVHAFSPLPLVDSMQKVTPCVNIYKTDLFA